MEAEVKTKSDNEIRLKKNEDILRFKIVDEEGNDTGNFLEFNLEDIELPLRYQELVEKDKYNKQQLKNQYIIIEKKQDHRGKKLLSANEEARIKAMRDFYLAEKEVYDMFLGKGGVDKLLNGREMSWGTLAEIDEIIEQAILPKLEINAEKIKNKIMQKYSPKRDDVIE